MRSTKMDPSHRSGEIAGEIDDAADERSGKGLIIDQAKLRLYEVDLPLHVSFGSLAIRRMLLLEVHAGG